MWGKSEKEFKNPFNISEQFKTFIAIGQKPKMFPERHQAIYENQSAYLVKFEKFMESLFIDLKNIQEGKIDPTMPIDKRLLSVRDVVNFFRESCGYDIKLVGE